LGALIYDTDPLTGERLATINPKLPKILERFAFFLDQNSGGTLYQKVFQVWLAAYLEKTGVTFTVQGSGLNRTYKLLPGLQNSSNLLAEMEASLSKTDGSAPYAYVGLYLLTAWYFLVDSADGDYFSDAVKRYIAMKCLKWNWPISSKKAISIRPKFIRTSNYTNQFLGQLRVKNYSLTAMTSRSNLGDTDSVFDLPGSLPDDTKAGAIRTASYEFIKFFRSLFVSILNEEYLILLKEIGGDVAKKLNYFRNFGVGNGSGTFGLFGGSRGYGMSFINYDSESVIRPPYFKPKGARSESVKSVSDAAPPILFLVQWGANDPGPYVKVSVDGKTDPQKIAVDNAGDSFLADATGKDHVYKKSTGLLTFKNRAIGAIELQFESLGDETVFLLFSFSSLPTIPPSIEPKLRIDDLFLDNEFAIPTSKYLAFWTSFSEQAALDSLVLKMRDDPTFQIISSISGKGIGVRVDLNGPDEFASDLVSAPDQSDNQTPNSVATGNQGLRYAYGEAIWTTVSGEPSVLSICTEGYASPLRCTWDNWPPFQLNTQPGFGGDRKIDELQKDIGQFLQSSLGRGASYNTALSAFRAFGILEAIVRRLQDCADDLTPTQLSATQRDAIKDKLDSFLDTQASCWLMQVGLDRETGVKIDYNMFRKYAY
jgi:hypothetical protein